MNDNYNPYKNLAEFFTYIAKAIRNRLVGPEDEAPTAENKITACYFPDLIRDIPSMIDYGRITVSQDVWIRGVSSGTAPTTETITFTFDTTDTLVGICAIYPEKEDDNLKIVSSGGEFLGLSEGATSITISLQYSGFRDYEGTIYCEGFARQYGYN